jgi:hypothetical protein
MTIDTVSDMSDLDVFTSGSPGSLLSVNGTINRCRYGPRTSSGDKGWSGDGRVTTGVNGVVHNIFMVAGATATLGLADTYYFLNSIDASFAGTNPSYLTTTYQNNGNMSVGCYLRPTINNNFWYQRSNQWTDQDSGIPVPFGYDFYLRHSWSWVVNTVDYKLAYRKVGTSTWTIIFASTFLAQAPLDRVKFGHPSLSGSAPFIRGRYGRPATASIASLSERDDPLPGWLDPVVGPHDFYLDPTSGNDSNDGSTLAQAWKTGTKVSTEAQYGGFFVPAIRWWDYYNGVAFDHTSFDLDEIHARYANKRVKQDKGDRLIVVSNSGVEQRLTDQIKIFGYTHGIRLMSNDANRVNLTHKVVIPGSAWSATSGYAGVYEALIASATSLGLYQNGRRLKHFFGANDTAALTLLQAGTGGFYFSNSVNKMYVKPLDGLDPTTVGTNPVFERNQFDGNMIQIDSADCTVNGFILSGTIPADPTSSNEIGGYSLGGALQGLSVLSNLDSLDGGKHNFGGVGARGNKFRCLWINIQMAGLSPNTGFGGASSLVFYGDNGATNGQEGLFGGFIRGGVNELNGQRVLTTTSLPAITMHGTLTNNYERFFLINADLAQGGFIDHQFANVPLKAVGCNLFNPYMPFSSQDLIWENCLFNYIGPFKGTMNRCAGVFKDVTTSSSSDFNRIANTAVFNNCLLDFRNLNGPAISAYYKYSYAFNWTFNNCAIILPSGVGFLDGLIDGDGNKLRFNSCKWFLGDGTTHMILYNHNGLFLRPLDQMQNLGIDLNGQIYTAAPSLTSWWPTAFARSASSVG